MMPLDPSYVTGTTRKIFRDSVHRTIQYYLRQYSEQWFQVSEITLVKYPYRIFPDAYVEATINYTVTVRSNITENAISLLNDAIWSGQFLHTLNRYTKVFSPKNPTNINTFNSNFFSAIGVPTITPTMQPTRRPAGF